MECMSFSRLFIAVSLILIYVTQKLFGLAYQAGPMNLKPILNDDMDVRHLAFEDQLQFIDSDDFKTDNKLLDNNNNNINHYPHNQQQHNNQNHPNNQHQHRHLNRNDIQLDSLSVSYLSMSVLLFERLILAIGMVIMILVSILIAYLEAMLYLRSQHGNSAQTANGHTVSHSDHQNGGSNKDYERNNCSNHFSDACNKDRSNGSGHGATAISASISNQQSLQQLNGGSGKNSNNIHINKINTSNNKSNNSSNNSNNCTQRRRKNSSIANSEKVPTSNKSIGSTNSDKKSSSPYAPIFQNLTNVIASPPPPLPTFDSEFDSLEFKKLRGKKSTKKSNSLNGSTASSDDIGNHNLLNQNQVGNSNQVNKTKTNGKANGIKMSGNSLVNGEREIDLQGQIGDQSSRTMTQDQKGGPKDVFKTTSHLDEHISSDKIKLYDCVEVGEGSNQEQATVMPIQPPSSLSSAPSSSTSSTASTSSSASSSPPLSASSYGEYSLLGPGATFELPCLRVRSAQI